MRRVEFLTLQISLVSHSTRLKCTILKYDSFIKCGICVPVSEKYG